ncbi:hypothetical protein [Actinomadura citrea]|uniref:Uncharacterized protein n=1 Tax=Actinomadura citrea TaxID=46158 RepID=A0A7Y9GEV7_9ACTN|nr:hypothetical protein [Actinomadura citrea]NYE15242.1 hypothetical protein [Actinomadura citrea]GGT94396.1 hypothetical protein GCM10010177_61980 [Actinomadura citrea]
MPVSSDQVATLRAQLSGQADEHRRLLRQLDPEQAKQGYAALVAAAFVVAVERRFRQGEIIADDSEVIEFVASARERSDDSAEIINPDVAEKMILTLLGRGSIATLDENTKLEHQIILLAALIGQAQLDDPELDAFIAEARTLADEILQ